MGNNRQGSGHDQDESGSLDVIAENSGQAIYVNRSEMGMMIEQSNQHPDRDNEEP